jgi:homoserine kinase type II
MLARMHLAGTDFPLRQPNLRGLPWWNETAPVILPYLEPAQAELLQGELAYQNHVAAGPRTQRCRAARSMPTCFATTCCSTSLPAASDDRAGPVLSGFFDFYFAGVDTWLFDIAVCLNDWCIDLDTGQRTTARHDAFLQAYDQCAAVDRAERRLLPAMQRAGALRFWISRLWDLHLPREASMLKPHDPTHFERVLRQRVAELDTR